MLPKKNRLKKEKNFEKVFKNGKTDSNEYLVVKLLENDKNKKRIGFVAPVKNFKKATDRNETKRKMREAVRSFLEDIEKGYDIIVIANDKIKKLEVKEISEEVKKILSKLKVLNNDH